MLMLAMSLPLAAQETARPSPLDRIEMAAHARLAQVRDGAHLAPFTTDGCSGGLSAIWRAVARQFPGFADVHRDTPPWESCCVTHDRAYHMAGPDPAPAASFEARLQADRTLRACVQDTAAGRRAELADQYGMTAAQVDNAYAAIAAAMFEAVRLGGAPCSGLPWRWGYGWPDCGLLGGAD